MTREREGEGEGNKEKAETELGLVTYHVVSFQALWDLVRQLRVQGVVPHSHRTGYEHCEVVTSPMRSIRSRDQGWKTRGLVSSLMQVSWSDLLQDCPIPKENGDRT